MTIHRLLILCVAGRLAMLAFSAGAQPAGPATGVPARPQATPSASAAPQSPSLQSIAQPGTVLERVVAGAGVQTCLPAVRTLGPALTGPENSYAAALLANPAAPDTSAFTASIERADPAGTRFVSAFFAPTPKGGCDVSYDMVDVWNKSCQDVAVQDLKYTKALNVIGRDVSVIPYNAFHHIYLIRTASGCITINKEILYP